MKLQIEIKLDNAALVDGGIEEIRRILDHLCENVLAEPLTETSSALPLRDINGNRVGEARIS